MDKLKTYDEVIKYLNSQSREHHLLMGNGFSISYDKAMFSYNALHQFIMNNRDDVVQRVFNVLNTQNFELVMQQLDNFADIAAIFNTPKNIINDVSAAVNSLRGGLVDAITSLHPDHVFSVPDDKSKSCASFFSEYLNNNGHIFSTNYDLLMYWILMRNNIDNCIDGFGRYAENLDDGEYVEEDDIEWSDLTWGVHKFKQNIHYLHGALPLFDEGSTIIKAESNGEWLLDVVKRKIQEKKYPIFVAAGDSKQKMEHISHNKYLTFCYDKLTEITGSLIVFGFSFGENDGHIIDAINKAAKQGKNHYPKLISVYIGVFSESDYEHITKLRSKFKCKVNLFDAKTVNIWDK